MFSAWEEYNAAVSEDLCFQPTSQPAVYDGGQGVVNDLRDLDGLAEGPDRLQLFMLPVGTYVAARPAEGDERVGCAILACGLGWQPPVVSLVQDATLHDAKWVFAMRPATLTAALHTARGFR
ncbi:MAG: hypothetical protein JWN52_3626 [Actinomycetia bacterium]|nr:hypothetical protein [Actinomycetes bacterium]